jgi:hypothetical protein
LRANPSVERVLMVSSRGASEGVIDVVMRVTFL